MILEKAVKNVEILTKTKDDGNKAMFRELRERESKADNLIIHQLQEPPGSMTRGGDKKQFDVNQVLELFEFIGCKQDASSFKFIFRAGEKTDSDRPRPVIMCLKDPGARKYILDNTRLLANSIYSHVSIVPDLTPQQRREEDELRKEAETLNNAMDETEALNWEWVLLGVQGKRTLIKRRKFNQGGGEERRPFGGGRGSLASCQPF